MTLQTMANDAFELVNSSVQRLKGAATAASVEPTQQEINELYNERITPETDLPPMQPLMQMFGVPCFYRGEVVADGGKAKSGKTFFLSILMATCLSQKVLELERYGWTEDSQPSDFSPLKVLWIDTEQSQQSTQEILRDRIIPLAGGNVPDLDSTFYAFNLRGLGFEKRQKMVEIAIKTIKADIVIIDGIKDLMTDINDAVQATIIMEKIMALAKENECCIVCVLHQNKSEQDRNMRGSIGTELTNKAFEVFQCDVFGDCAGKGDTFRVTHAYSRKKRMHQKLYYRINEQGLPELLADYHERPRDEQGRWISTDPATEANAENLLKLFTNAMEGKMQRPFGEVMAVALKKYGVINAQAFYHYVDQAEELEIIHKETHPETGKTWIVLDDGSLPLII